MNQRNHYGSKTLVVAPSWIGDAVLSQPMLAKLVNLDPTTCIEVLAPKWVLPVYRRMSEVTGTIENPFGHGQLALAARYRLGRTLERRGYTNAYVLPNSLKSALIPWFARIANRVGYRGEMRYGLLTDRRNLDKQALPLMVERFAWLAQSAASSIDRPVPHPRLQVDRNQIKVTLDRLGLTAPKRVACFCPGAEYGPAKRWPTEHFANLATQLLDRGFAVWLLGSSADKSVGDNIVRASDQSVRNLCGSTSLDDAIDLLSTADLVITNDSGLMHIAAALDRPTVAIYGSSSPEFTPPLSSHARVVNLELQCSPCFARTCPLGHFDCMKAMGPDKVLATVEALGIHI